MKAIRKLMLATAMVLGATASIAAMKDPMVGGAAMYPTKNIIQNAVNSKDHTTLVAAVKAADLVDTLSGPGPFTVFAPTNAACGDGRHASQAREQGAANRRADLSRHTGPHHRRCHRGQRCEAYGQGNLYDGAG